MDKEGKKLKKISIDGFIRSQAYGENHSKRRIQYIPGFESSRWVSQGIKIVKNTSR